MIPKDGGDMVPDRPERAILDQIAEIEAAAEARWMAEFARFQQEQEDRVGEITDFYADCYEFVEEAMLAAGEPMPAMGALGNNGVKLDREALPEATKLLKMGMHFRFLLEEVKRQPSIQSHWEEFMMLLKLAEDDETRNYYRF